MFVVTADPQATAIAQTVGAVVLDESVPSGLNSALLGAVASLNDTTRGIVVVPADIPQLSSDAIDYVVDAVSTTESVALQRASDGGTNLLACRPAGVIQPHFGSGSFDAHVAAAQRAGVVPRVIDWPGLDLDLDRPEDLLAFLALHTSTRSHACAAQVLSLGMTSRAIVSI